MFRHLLHRLFIILRRFLLDNRLTRWSFRMLLFLSSLLRRQFPLKGRPPPTEKSQDGSHPEINSFDFDNSVVCHGVQPRLPTPKSTGNPFHNSAVAASPSHAPLSLYPFSGQSASLDVTELNQRKSVDRLCVSRASGALSPNPSRTPSPNSTSPLSPRSAIPGPSNAAPTPGPSLGSACSKLKPIAAEEYQRYERKFYTPRDYHVKHSVPPLRISFNNDVAPPGWISFVHPEGALYFFHEQKKILTDAYLYDRDVLSDLDGFIHQIERYMKDNKILLPDDVDLVLDLTKDKRGETTCGYYFANHATRYLFWLDNYPANVIFGEVHAKISSSHMGHEIESQYWYHGELFPQTRKISMTVINELKDTLNHAIGDMLTSSTSTVAYSLKDLQDMRSLVKDIAADADVLSGGSACILNRLMSNFAHERFLSHHGQRTARLCRDQSVHGDAVGRRTWLMWLISPPLFFAPNVHLERLEKMTIDQIVNRPSWQRLLDELTSEWREFILYATVLLNANVAFLAIQSVDSSGNAAKRSFVQRSSYCSIVASIGTIVIGLLLARQHHTKLDIKFLANRSVSALGLETLAIMYSLPYVLLMWGMFCFLLAFTFMCINKDNLTNLLISISWATIAFLVVWTVSTLFEKRPYWRAWPSEIWKNLKEATRTRTARRKAVQAKRRSSSLFSLANT